MPLPRMVQSSARPRVADIPGGVRQALLAARLSIGRGVTVAVGAGSRGIANMGVIVRATVDALEGIGARVY
jgi:hypothetical protein